jgi:uncharacterized protein YchJ
MTTQTTSSLSPVQAQVVASLAAGLSISSTAELLHLGRTTIHSWLHNQSFAEAVNLAKHEFVLTLRDTLRDASLKAIHTIIDIMDDPKAPAGVRLKAALAVLNRPHFPKQGWHLPEKIESPDKEAVLENLAALEASQRQVKLAETVLQHSTETFLNNSEHNFTSSETEPPAAPAASAEAPAHTPPNTSEHKNTPIRVNKTGRNEPCHCGSGKKFKRCCLNNPQAAAAAN